MKAFTSFGLPVLRFNFRGVGLSEGTHDNGHGEQDDVHAALDRLTAEFHRQFSLPDSPSDRRLVCAACCGDPRVVGLIGLGLPVRAGGRDYTYGFLPQCSAPKLFISGDHDEFGPRDLLTEVWLRAPEPKRTVWIEGANHFFPRHTRVARRQALPDAERDARVAARDLCARQEYLRNLCTSPDSKRFLSRDTHRGIL